MPGIGSRDAPRPGPSSGDVSPEYFVDVREAGLTLMMRRGSALEAEAISACLRRFDDPSSFPSRAVPALSAAFRGRDGGRELGRAGRRTCALDARASAVSRECLLSREACDCADHAVRAVRLNSLDCWIRSNHENKSHRVVSMNNDTFPTGKPQGQVKVLLFQKQSFGHRKTSGKRSCLG